MKILYGVSGEGFGHSSRSKEIISYLEKKKHKVLVFTYGQAFPILKKVGFKIIKIEGIELIFKKNKLSLKETTIHNIKNISRNLKNFYKLKKIINNFSPNICISDMEPVVPIISYWKKLTLISIDNQHRLTHLKLNIPKKCIKDFLIAKTAIRSCISKAEGYIIFSFVKRKILKKKGYVVNPILREEILKLKPIKGNKILVYQTKPNKSLIKILKTLKEKFIIYGYNLEKKEKNIEFKKRGAEFIKDLEKCKAIIATSGFTLISEALYLKKPYFAIPLKGQFEQLLNSLFLKESGFGEYSEEPTKKEITNFLSQTNEYKKRLTKYKTNPKEIFKVLDKILKDLKPKNLITSSLLNKSC